jgi:CheY-like chemotaxis protein
LVAEDDPVSRLILQDTLGEWGYEVVATRNGVEAWQILKGSDPPALAILDWIMPGLDGIDVCRLVRHTPNPTSTYIILLTARERPEDVVGGFEAGADDYMVKPCDREELRARLKAGSRIVELQQSLRQRVRELEEALARVRQLQGLLPICAYCKKIRDDKNYWEQVDTYIAQHSDAKFSHGVCPSCWDQYVEPEMRRLEAGQSPLRPPAPSPER